MPLRLVHYLPGIQLAEGGVVRTVLDTCRLMAARGHDVTLMAYHGEDMPPAWWREPDQPAAPGLPRAFLLPKPRPPLKLLGREAMRRARDAIAHADVLHLHGPWLDGNRQLAAVATKLGVPYVVTLHGMLDDWSMRQRPLKKRLYLALAGRRILNRAAGVHCTATAELAQAGRWFNNQRTIVLPCLFDLAPFQNLPGPAAGHTLAPTPPGHARLLFLSRLHEQKGVDTLLRAAAVLRDRGTPFTLLLAGSGTGAYEATLRDLVTELRLTDHVRFLGLVTGDAKLSLYQSADLFVLPTRHENFGLVLIEAMAAGTPIVTTRGTDIWQELQRAGGTICDDTPEAIATAVAAMLADPARLDEERHCARAWAFQTLAVDPLVKQYEAWYGHAQK